MSRWSTTDRIRRKSLYMKDETKLVALGRPRTDAAGDQTAHPVNPPVDRASTILYPTYADYQEGARAIRYGRLGTSTHRAFEDSITALEGGHSTRLAPSGLAAITAALLAFLSAGDHVLITDSAYDPTRLFAERFLKRFGVEVDYYSPTIGAGIADLLRPETKVIFAESPGSQTFEIQDLPALAKAARNHGAVLIVDNTWGAGLYLKPIALGAHVSLQAGTKHVVGHSDVLIGTITSADAETAEKIYLSILALGYSVSPDDVYLAHRGLRTMAMRLARYQETGLKLARYLEARPEVARVIHPALESHPGHALWKRDFTGAAGLFATVFAPVEEAPLAAFFNALKLFGMGFSWGGYESLAVRVKPQHARSVEPWTEPGPVVRFHTGLEDFDDLARDLDQAFAAMAAA